MYPQAIPTNYAGMLFRSRLEADWAATLDSLHITWEYEPEGFRLSDGLWYSPDFYLPSANAWLEVKGSHMQRVDAVERFAADLWGDSGASDTYHKESPMIILATDPYNPLKDFGGDPDDFFNQLQYRWYGVFGPDKRYSVLAAVCPLCTLGTVITPFQPWCRSCGGEPAPDDSPWHGWDSWTDQCLRPFVRLPRLAGTRQ